MTQGGQAERPFPSNNNKLFRPSCIKSKSTLTGNPFSIHYIGRDNHRVRHAASETETETETVTVSITVSETVTIKRAYVDRKRLFFALETCRHATPITTHCLWYRRLLLVVST